MTKDKAIFIAFLVAPLASASIGISQTAVFGRLDLVTFLGLLPIFYTFSLMAILLLGLPMFILFRKYNFIRWWSTIGTGIILGGGLSLITMLPNPVQITAVITMSSAGGASAFIFWLIWRLGSE